MDLIIHGTPYGHDVWGADDVHKYVSLFYATSPRYGRQLVVDIIQVGSGSKCVAYTYLVGGLKDCEGRPGSFLGITLCMDTMFCCDVRQVYEILDLIYRNYAVGHLLSGDGKYLIPSFSNLDSHLYAIQDFAMAQIKSSILDRSYKPLNALSISKTSTTVDVNPADLAGADATFKLMQQGHRLMVSPEIPTMVLVEAEKTIECLKAEIRDLNLRVNKYKEQSSRPANEIELNDKAVLRSRENHAETMPHSDGVYVRKPAADMRHQVIGKDILKGDFINKCRFGLIGRLRKLWKWVFILCVILIICGYIRMDCQQREILDACLGTEYKMSVVKVGVSNLNRHINGLSIIGPDTIPLGGAKIYTLDNPDKVTLEAVEWSITQFGVSRKKYDVMRSDSSSCLVKRILPGTLFVNCKVMVDNTIYEYSKEIE